MGARYIGQVLMTGYDTSKSGTQLPDFGACDGALMALTQNQALFALIGTTYGGNGMTTFALPDLRGRAPIAAGSSQDPVWQPTPWAQGQIAGVETVALTGNQGFPHGHDWTATTILATANAIPGSLWGMAQSNSGAGQNDQIIYSDTASDPSSQDPAHIGSAGSSVPHNNMQPYLTLCFSIALAGIYPG
jgi:microcystin-dependent protein